MTGSIKEAQRAELYKTTRCITNDLRGSGDRWGLKSYVLDRFFGFSPGETK